MFEVGSLRVDMGNPGVNVRLNNIGNNILKRMFKRREIGQL
jgi:hypothetical protein